MNFFQVNNNPIKEKQPKKVELDTNSKFRSMNDFSSVSQNELKSINSTNLMHTTQEKEIVNKNIILFIISNL